MGRLSKAALAAATLQLLTASAAWAQPDDLANRDLKTDTRDFYFPGYRITKVIEFQDITTKGADGKIVDVRSEPAWRDTVLTGQAKADVLGLWSRVSPLCLDAALGPEHDYQGFRRLTPGRLISLARIGRPRVTRTYVTGFTSYEGPEDQAPGEFTCVVEGGTVLAWTFREFHDGVRS